MICENPNLIIIFLYHTIEYLISDNCDEGYAKNGYQCDYDNHCVENMCRGGQCCSEEETEPLEP